MKLLNFALTIALATLPALASAKNHDTSKYESSKNIFAVDEGESLSKSLSKSIDDLENHYLVGSSSKLSSDSDRRKQKSDDSFVSKLDSDDHYSKNNSWFDADKFLTNSNFNFFINAGDSHTAIIVLLVFGDHFKLLDWDSHGWGNHHDWNEHHDWDKNHCHDPVPEPSSYALMLVGLLGLGFIQRKKR